MIHVYDREGQPWEFDRATRADVGVAAAPLRLLNDAGDLVGGFNAQSWTHFYVDQPKSSGDIGQGVR